MDIEILGLSLDQIVIILIFIFIAFVFKGFFASFILKKLKKFIQKKKYNIEDKFIEVLEPPLKIIPFIFAFTFFGFFLNINSQLAFYFEKINQTLLTVFIFWFLHQSLALLSFVFIKLENLLSKALTLWIFKSLKYLIIFLGSVAVLESWGIQIGPIIAGLGLFGVAVALGAQDLFKNLISGIMIILEKRFKINDVVEVPGYAVGTVELIGFRSTLIRQFDSTPISIPNYVFSEMSLINFSNREYRQIKLTIGLTYNTSIVQLKNICKEIDSDIRNKQDFIVNDNYKLFVTVEKFNDSSLDIFISTFANTNDWGQYLKIKENLVFSIKNIVESNNCAFAFPSHSVYIEHIKKDE